MIESICQLIGLLLVIAGCIIAITFNEEALTSKKLAEEAIKFGLCDEITKRIQVA